jgi:hypothetical protein
MPTGHGIRVVKPRSAKQRESAMRYRESQPKIQPTTVPPSESWWTKPQTREEFDQAVVKEAPRMQGQTLKAVAKGRE